MELQASTRLRAFSCFSANSRDRSSRNQRPAKTPSPSSATPTIEINFVFSFIGKDLLGTIGRPPKKVSHYLGIFDSGRRLQRPGTQTGCFTAKIGSVFAH